MKSLISSLIGLVLSVNVGAEPLLEGRVWLDFGEPVADAEVRLEVFNLLGQRIANAERELGVLKILIEANAAQKPLAFTHTAATEPVEVILVRIRALT